MKKVGLVLTCLAMFAGGAYAAGNFVQDSGVVTYSNPSTALSSGELVDLGDRYGVCLVDIASNKSGAVATKGIFSLARYDTNAVANGASLYYASASQVSGTAAADRYVGQCVEAVAAVLDLTNSLGQVTEYVKVDLNVPQRATVVGTDVQAYDADLARLALNNGSNLTNITATPTFKTTSPVFAATNAPTITITLFTGVGFDSTGAAITNAAGAEMALVTNVTATCAGLTAGATVAIVTNATIAINP